MNLSPKLWTCHQSPKQSFPPGCQVPHFTAKGLHFLRGPRLLSVALSYTWPMWSQCYNHWDPLRCVLVSSTAWLWRWLPSLSDSKCSMRPQVVRLLDSTESSSLPKEAHWTKQWFSLRHMETCVPGPRMKIWLKVAMPRYAKDILTAYMAYIKIQKIRV